MVAKAELETEPCDRGSKSVKIHGSMRHICGRKKELSVLEHEVL